MKKRIIALFATTIIFASSLTVSATEIDFTAMTEQEIMDIIKSANEELENRLGVTVTFGHIPATINPSPDKCTWYIKDYVGLNLASFKKYNNVDRLSDEYGDAKICFNLVSENGEYVDVENPDELKNYVVIWQSLEPNTELKLTFAEEDDPWPETQTYEDMTLKVAKISSENTITQ